MGGYRRPIARESGAMAAVGVAGDRILEKRPIEHLANMLEEDKNCFLQRRRGRKELPREAAIGSTAYSLT